MYVDSMSQKTVFPNIIVGTQFLTNQNTCLILDFHKNMLFYLMTDNALISPELEVANTLKLPIEHPTKTKSVRIFNV